MHLHSFDKLCDHFTFTDLLNLCVILCHENITAKKTKVQECEVIYTRSHIYNSTGETR